MKILLFNYICQVSVLSLYSVAIDNPARLTSLHLCISGCHGNLEDEDVLTIEQKCNFLGMSAILFFMDITRERKSDEVMINFSFLNFMTRCIQGQATCQI